MNQLKNILFSSIHYEGAYYNQIFDIMGKVIFPDYTAPGQDGLNMVYAGFHDTLTGNIRYELSPFPYYGILYTSTGSCNMLYDNSSYLLKPGTIAFLDFHLPCSIYKNNEEPWEHFFFITNGLLCPFYHSIFYEHKQAVMQLSPRAGTPNRLHTLYALTQSSFSEEADLLIPHKLITDILTTLTLEQHNNPHIQKSVPQHISSVLSYIHQHYTEPLSLELLARQAHVGKYALSHDFTRYIGTSVMDYVCIQRIEQGKLLLSTSGASIFDISYQLGFSSDAHFVSTFKKRTGITPLQYRKQCNAHQEL